MVSTRHHPREFPEPTTPTHRSSPSATVDSTPSTPPPKTTTLTKSPTKSPMKRKASTKEIAAPIKDLAASITTSTHSAPASSSDYTHVPDTAILLWLLVSLPLVFWDTCYVMGRPHTMPGGKFHSPFWTPYALYGTIDYIYGWPAFNNNVGFTAAQGSLNIAETLGYLWYLAVVWTKGGEGKKQFWKENFPVRGEGVGLAVLVCFATAVMTVSKTVLYWLNEAFSGFENIGHNEWGRLIVLWIIPNGAWIVLPGYMTYVLGKEIVQALDGSGKKQKTR